MQFGNATFASAVAVVLSFSPAPVLAQSLNAKPAKTSSVTTAAPRAADGHPDLQGVWS